MSATSPRGRLLEVAAVFGRLGATAFGGPAVHIALMEDELVRRRGWVTRERFLDLLGAAFILPAALSVAALAWVYVRFGARPDVAAVLAGVKPVVVVVVLDALWKFARTLVRTRAIALLAGAATLAAALGANELALLVGAGLASAAFRAPRAKVRASAAPLLVPLAAGIASAAG